MNSTASKSEITYRRDDWVTVLSPEEIAATLDENGALHGIPFMPEMLTFCGKSFQVQQRLAKTCIDVWPWNIQKFIPDDVYSLEGTQCSGLQHDGCQKQCRILWKSDWLRPATEPCSHSRACEMDANRLEALRGQLKTVSSGAGSYFCQASQLLAVTRPMSKWEKILQCFRDVRNGNLSWWQAVTLAAVPLVAKCGKWLGALRGPQGTLTRTPTESLELHDGDWVEVKTLSEIQTTLDRSGRNRGLTFDFAMQIHCGKRYRVLRRLDRMIREDQGTMKRVSNTVILEGVDCPCSLALGGCPRGAPVYWREIWLRRL